MKKKDTMNILNKTRLMSTVVVVLMIGSIVVSGVQTMDNEPPKINGTPDGGHYTTTVRVSVTSEGLELKGPKNALGSREAAITPDGRFVVFTSDAENLPGYTNPNPNIGRIKQVYVHDRDFDENGIYDEQNTSGVSQELERIKTVLISKSTQESNFLEAGDDSSGGFVGNPNGPGGDVRLVEVSHRISISSDGRFVVFTSHARNFFPGMQSSTVRNPHVYLHDRDVSGNKTFDEPGDICTELIDWKIDGTTGKKTWSDGAGLPAISDDGNYVLFCSVDVYYGPGQDGGLFMLDRRNNTFIPVTQNQTPTGQPSMTPDGQFIVYPSSNLSRPNENRNGLRLYNRVTAEDKSLVSCPSGYAYHCLWPDISDDGNLIAFTSNDDNLVENDTNGYYDVFILDRNNNNLISLVSVNSSGTSSGNGPSGCVDPRDIGVSISPDGNYVAFMSDASDLIKNYNGLQTGIYLRDRLSGTTELVSVNSAGHDPHPSNCAWPSVSLQAGYIAFDSNAENFVPGIINPDPRNRSPWAGDNNDMPDVFVRNRICSCFYLRGDMNCDGKVDFDDIDPFVLALFGKAAYTSQYPNCCWENADCNGDGKVDFNDIDPFIKILSGN